MLESRLVLQNHVTTFCARLASVHSLFLSNFIWKSKTNTDQSGPIKNNQGVIFLQQQRAACQRKPNGSKKKVFVMTVIKIFGMVHLMRLFDNTGYENNFDSISYSWIPGAWKTCQIQSADWQEDIVWWLSTFV